MALAAPARCDQLHGEEVYRERFGGFDALRDPDLWLLRRLIGPREDGVGDPLSYLCFDPSFINAAIDLGIEHATKVVEGPGPMRWVAGPGTGLAGLAPG